MRDQLNLKKKQEFAESKLKASSSKTSINSTDSSLTLNTLPPFHPPPTSLGEKNTGGSSSNCLTTCCKIVNPNHKSLSSLSDSTSNSFPIGQGAKSSQNLTTLTSKDALSTVTLEKPIHSNILASRFASKNSLSNSTPNLTSSSSPALMSSSSSSSSLGTTRTTTSTTSPLPGLKSNYSPFASQPSLSSSPMLSDLGGRSSNNSISPFQSKVLPNGSIPLTAPIPPIAPIPLSSHMYLLHPQSLKVGSETINLDSLTSKNGGNFGSLPSLTPPRLSPSPSPIISSKTPCPLISHQIVTCPLDSKMFNSSQQTNPKQPQQTYPKQPQQITPKQQPQKQIQGINAIDMFLEQERNDMLESS